MCVPKVVEARVGRQAGALITGAEEAIADLQALIEAQATAA
jgi:hypothetical protein